MKQVQRLLKQLIENPEAELAQTMTALAQSEDPGQWEELIWQMSMALGRGTLEKRLEQTAEPPGSDCPHCSSAEQPPSSPDEAALSPLSPPRRRLYRCGCCGREHAWLDGRLGLVGAQTAAAAQLAALLSVELPERRAVAMLKQLCGIRLGAATAWRNRQSLGGRARGLIRRQTEQWLAPVSPERPGPQVAAPAAELIVREADGVMVRFMDGWHEVKVGESHGLGQPQPKKEGRRKRVIEPQYCALRGAPGELGRQLQALSLSQGLRRAPASAFISDGGGWMAGLAREALSWSRWTLDFYHASQQVAAALGALHGVGSPRAQREHRRLRRQLLRQGGNARVRRSLQAQAQRLSLKRERERAVLRVIRYLQRHQAQTDYARLRKMNWPIASAEIEGGACKLYIQQRFKRPGARWSQEGFANLEALRRLAYNDQWHLLAQRLHSKN